MKSVQESVEAEYTRLIQTALKASLAYYNTGETVMEDEEYDALVEQIRSYETIYSFSSPDSPTQAVGAPVSGDAAPHPVPMLSLAKVTTEEEVEKFVSSFPTGTFRVEPKLDGISMSLEYTDGKLVRAMTRGDGRRGEEVTDKMIVLDTIPTNTGDNFTGVVRGELVIHRDELSPRFKNTRNGVAGSVASSKVYDARDEKARFYAFDAPGVEQDVMGQLERWGFTPAYSLVTSFSGVFETIEGILDNRADLPYDIDGVVVKVADPKIRAGLEDRTNTPRWAIAFKRAARPFYSTVLDLEINVGKSGQLGLRYRIAPVDSGISTVEYATAHNFAEIERHDVRRGDKVTLRLMGDVIPGIVCVTDPSLRDGTEEKFEKPTECPRCAAPVEEFGNRQQLRCTGTDCVGTLNRRLEHWAGRKQADIDGLSTDIIGKLVEKGRLTNVADFYTLTREDFTSIGRTPDFGNKMLAAINTSRGVGMRRALIGFSIPSASEGTAARLCKHFASMDELLGASFADLCGVEDVGIVVAQSLHDFLNSEKNRDLIMNLQDLGVNLNRLSEDAPLELSDTSGLAFDGMTVVVTGTLSVSRDVFKAELVQNGAKMTGSVSKNTSILVIGDNVGQAKITKAKALGTTVITEEVARQMMA